VNSEPRRRVFAVAGALALFGALLVYTLPRTPAPRAEHARAATPRAPEPVASDAEPGASGAIVASAPAPLSASGDAKHPTPSETFDEPELMRLLRSARGNDPALAVELAREGNRRFPTSPDAPERASILIHALSEEGRTSEARGEAEDMVNRYPDSTWVQEIERFTGAHRHRNVRVNAEGKLEFYDPPPG
jgi:hypothetical protein